MQKWTVELCKKDSDGDGKTNGQELGDPRCIWVEGDVPEFLDDLSHPGEKINSTQYKNAHNSNISWRRDRWVLIVE